MSDHTETKDEAGLLVVEDATLDVLIESARAWGGDGAAELVGSMALMPTVDLLEHVNGHGFPPVVKAALSEYEARLNELDEIIFERRSNPQ